MPYLYDTGFILPGGREFALNHYLVALLQVGSFSVKTVFFSWFLLVVRWTLPRFPGASPIPAPPRPGRWRRRRPRSAQPPLWTRSAPGGGVGSSTSSSQPSGRATARGPSVWPRRSRRASSGSSRAAPSRASRAGTRTTASRCASTAGTRRTGGSPAPWRSASPARTSKALIR